MDEKVFLILNYRLCGNKMVSENFIVIWELGVCKR